MQTNLATIRGKLSEYGLTDSEYLRFMESVARIISARPQIALEELAFEVKKLGWPRLAADAEIIQAIQTLFCDPGSQFQLEGDGSKDQGVKDPQGMQELVEKIRREKGFDFRHYAKPSLNRRFLRRLLSRGVDSYQQYMAVLDRDSDEYARLFSEAVVRVTRFFRNEVAFAALDKALVQTINAKIEKTLRIWSAGCCTGQEPYTIAMLLRNILGDAEGWQVEIMATDIDPQGLNEGKRGWFAAQAVEDIPPEWLERYFARQQGGYVVKAEIGDWVTFFSHNLVCDAPLQDIDIIVCRNVLIYFEPLLQIRILERFADALSVNGFLLLGRYEMLLKQARNRFSTIDFDARLYRKTR